MSGALRYLPNYTYEDYLHWEGRWEVIDGIPYAMSPIPTPYHQEIGGALIELFRRGIRTENCDCKVYQPIDIKINENTIVNPDVILCEEVSGQAIEFPPSLVVEILSPSSLLKDRHTKFELYQTFGIPYYLIVDLETKTVEIYRNNQQAGYARQLDDVVIKLHEHCTLNFDFNSIW